MEDHILTWDNLCKRGMRELNICPLGGCCEESVYHLFVSCLFAKSLWLYVYRLCNLPKLWCGNSLAECFTNYKMCGRTWMALPSFLCWGIWKVMNKQVFEGSRSDFIKVGTRGVATFREFIDINDIIT